MEKINIVTVDSASASLKIGIFADNKRKVFDVEDGFNHLENIIPLIDKGLNEINVEKKSLTVLGVSCGPGSFTGIRIGIATMQALSYALKIPLIGLNGLEIYKHLIKSNNTIIPLVDAKKKRFYCSFFNTDDDKMYDFTPDEILEKIKGKENVIFAGKDFFITKDFFDSHLSNYYWLYDKGYNADQLLDFSIKKAVTEDFGDIEPIYLRKSEAEIALLERNKIKD